MKQNKRPSLTQRHIRGRVIYTVYVDQLSLHVMFSRVVCSILVFQPRSFGSLGRWFRRTVDASRAHASYESVASPSNRLRTRERAKASPRDRWCSRTWRLFPITRFSLFFKYRFCTRRRTRSSPASHLLWDIPRRVFPSSPRFLFIPRREHQERRLLGNDQGGFAAILKFAHSFRLYLSSLSFLSLSLFFFRPKDGRERGEKGDPPRANSGA